MFNVSAFGHAMVIGFSIAAPVGPIGVLCIRRTLMSGMITGFVSGLGAATADALYGCIAGLGLTVLTDALVSHQGALRVLGGAFLIYLGVRAGLTPPTPLTEETSETGLIQLATAYGSTFILTLTNPATILAFLAIMSSMGLEQITGHIGAVLILVLGIFVGSALWWLLLSLGVNRLRLRPRRPNGHRFDVTTSRWINRLSGGILVGFGLVAIGSALWMTGLGPGSASQS
ncbi:MAG: LysE family transporter [Synechococcales cyanobacterium]